MIGDRVHLKVRPEVSTLDFANGVVLNGFRIPALSTRRTETELELHDGQTFAIAGLMNNTMNSTLQKIPGIGDIPILGLLFKSKAAQKDQTELVVMITPQILPRTLDRRDQQPAAHARAVPAAAAGEEAGRAAAAGLHAGASPAPRIRRPRRHRRLPPPSLRRPSTPAPAASDPPAARPAAAAAILNPPPPPVVVRRTADAPAPGRRGRAAQRQRTARARQHGRSPTPRPSR